MIYWLWCWDWCFWKWIWNESIPKCIQYLRVGANRFFLVLLALIMRGNLYLEKILFIEHFHYYPGYLFFEISIGIWESKICLIVFNRINAVIGNEGCWLIKKEVNRIIIENWNLFQWFIFYPYSLSNRLNCIINYSQGCGVIVLINHSKFTMILCQTSKKIMLKIVFIPVL
jgi:hypothetical protein